MIEQHLALEEDPTRPFAGFAVGYATQMFAEIGTDPGEDIVTARHRNAANQMDFAMLVSH